MRRCRECASATGALTGRFLLGCHVAPQPSEFQPGPVPRPFGPPFLFDRLTFLTFLDFFAAFFFAAMCIPFLYLPAPTAGN